MFNNRKLANKNGVAQITDTEGVLFTVACTAATDVTGVSGATGAVTGSPTFSSDGMKCASGDGIIFTSITGSSKLDYEGQIVFDVETEGIAEYDDGAATSGSTGRDSTATEYLFTCKDSGGIKRAEFLINSNEVTSCKLHGSDTAVTGQIHTAGKDSYTNICIWWKGTEYGVLVDGCIFTSGTRANRVSDQFNALAFGSLNGGGVTPFTYNIKNIVVSNKSPRMIFRQQISSIGIFGDSFAVNSTISTNNNPLYDATVGYRIQSRLAERGLKSSIAIDGHSGHSMCDTGTGDLVNDGDATTFAANEYEIVVIMAGNNDCTSSASQVANATTGTEARYKEAIERCAFSDYSTNSLRTRTRRIILTTAGSLKQKTSINTAANNANLVTVNGIINSLPDWWDATYPAFAGLVRVADLYNKLGDTDNNINYRGGVEGTDDNRHPSAFGHILLADIIYDEFYL